VVSRVGDAVTCRSSKKFAGGRIMPGTGRWPSSDNDIDRIWVGLLVSTCPLASSSPRDRLPVLLDDEDPPTLGTTFSRTFVT
jgi:hypothetical protein